MSQSLARNDLIFSTKNRQPFIVPTLGTLEKSRAEQGSRRGEEEFLEVVQTERRAEVLLAAGYGAFSVSASNEDKVGRYIRRQEEHHSATHSKSSSAIS